MTQYEAQGRPRKPAYQVTEWGDPKQSMQTSWGRLEYLHWLKMEVDRWYTKDMTEAWVMEHPNRSVAMFTNDERMIDLQETT